MKAVIITGVLALLFIITFIGINFNQQYVKGSYALEACRAKVITNYQKDWNNCCQESGQENNCKAKLSCEPSWNTYANQMSSCNL